MIDTRKSILTLSEFERELIMKLPESVFKRNYREPHMCSWTGAADRLFGCPFLFRGENHCPYCTLKNKNPVK